MKSLIQQAMNYKFSRRTFLKVSGITAALLMMGDKSVLAEISPKKAQEILEKEGEWKTAACWHNCGGRCLNKVYVVDGMVVRQKTDDTHPDSPEFPQQRACGRGRSQRKQVFGADRLKYPMIRKNWAPGGGKKELRGKDEWVRISWDKALEILASETKRIKNRYGNQSIYMLRGREMQRPMALFGGYVANRGSRSRGTWEAAMKPIVGVDRKSHIINDRMDLLNAKLIVLWGNNPAWSSAGLPMYNLLQAKKAGAKIISVDPYYNTTASTLADDFIPIRPATDTPMLLAMAYVMLTEDSPERPLIDWDFLHRCTVGFDRDHMPEGSDPNDNFKDYVLGTFDGQPKTPQWASEICGTPVETIRSFAIELATTKPATVLFGWNSARIEKGQHVPLAQISLGAMTGNMGIPGGAFGVSCQEPATNGGPALVRPGTSGLPSIRNPISIALKSNEHWNAILTGKYTAGKNDIREIDIRMIYHSGHSSLNQTNNINKGIKAHHKVEFIVTNQYALNPNAAYSDLVLPITTEWERFGTVLTGNREILIWTSQVTEPLFEAKDDLWIAKELGRRLGVAPETIEPISLKQQVFNEVAGATVMKEDASGYETLVTITEEDLQALGVEGKPQVGRIPLMEFKEKGIYQVPRSANDKFVFISNQKFRENPKKHPLDTASGKINLHCQELADIVTKAGYNVGIPIAKYVPPQEGYEATFADWNRKIKGEYPLQLCSIHIQRQTHSVMGNVPWLREAYTNDLLMNPVDAHKRKLRNNDVVRIFNKHGAVIRRVSLTECVMPGVVILGQGSWVELDDEGNCIAGSVNMLTGDYPSGPDIESFQACIVEVEKYNSPLALDHQWPQRRVF